MVTYRSWVVDNPEASGRWRLLDAESTRVHSSVFKVHRVAIGTPLLKDPKLGLLGEQDEPTHVRQLVLSLNGGPGRQGRVDFSPDWFLNRDVLQKIHIFLNDLVYRCIHKTIRILPVSLLIKFKQEAHGPYCSPEK